MRASRNLLVVEGYTDSTAPGSRIRNSPRSAPKPCAVFLG